MATILVTGGAGFIGSHTVTVLLEAGYDVVVVDNLSNSRMEAVRRVRDIAGKDFTFFQTDVCDKDAMTRVFHQQPIDAVIHFAGLKAVGESVANPLRYYRTNLDSTLTLLDLMDTFGVTRFVFSSSATVYGDPVSVPIPETAALCPGNPYGRTKLMQEEILRDQAAANPGWSVALLRYFNPIGAHPSGGLGEDPRGIPNNLLPYIAKVAVGRLPALSVMGDDYDTRVGTGVRDFVHVMYLADGHVAALKYIFDHPGVETFNLGTGTGYSVLEIVSAFERASGRTIARQVTARRPGDIATSYADPAKAKRMLGWAATRGLDEMCADLWHFQSQNPDGYGAG